MALLLLLVLLPFFSWAKVDFDKCLKQSLDRANYDAIFGAASGRGLFSQKDLEEINKDPIIRAFADQQRKLSSSIGEIPLDYVPASVTKNRDIQGHESEIVKISLTPFQPLKWRDPEKKKKYVEKVCDQTFGKLGEFCVKSYFAKEGFLNDFISKHSYKIQEMAKSILQNPRRNWTEVAGSYNFEFQSSRDYPFANEAYITQGEVRRLVLARDSNGKFSEAIGVDTGGKVEYYAVPNTGSAEAPALLNPYFFVFGGVPALEWNRSFGFGELKPFEG